MPIQSIRGMADVLPEEVTLWQQAEAEAHRLFSLYNYRQIRTPVVEALELFTRTLGETTAIIEKEMYSFEDRQGKKICLRPEGTASVIRAYIQSHYDQTEPLARLYYLGPMYRYERPQKGRLRQFHQIGAEVIGSSHPMVDAELIHLADQYFRLLGVDDLELEINSLGCTVCRPDFVAALVSYLDERHDRLCDDCLRRIVKNPMRVLDCKQEGCRAIAAEAPSIQEHLCDDCEEHFDGVLQGIGRLGSSYAINPNIVRGLDYYQRTAFEFTSQQLGAQNSVAGGGRYDGLLRLMGGPHLPGVGFAIGVERLVSLLQERAEARPPRGPLVFVAAFGSDAMSHGIALAQSLRQGGVRVEMNYEDKGLKALMKRANRISADFTVILGSDEVAAKKLILRNMTTSEQEELGLDDAESLLMRVQSS